MSILVATFLLLGQSGPVLEQILLYQSKLWLLSYESGQTCPYYLGFMLTVSSLCCLRAVLLREKSVKELGILLWSQGALSMPLCIIDCNCSVRFQQHTQIFQTTVSLMIMQGAIKQYLHLFSWPLMLLFVLKFKSTFSVAVSSQLFILC